MIHRQKSSRPISTSSRRGLAQRDVALIIASICLLLALAVPYIYRQRTLQRRRLCEARQYRIALAIIQTSVDKQQVPGYRVIQSENHRGELQASSWVFAALPYIHPLDVELSSLGNPDFEEWTTVETWKDNPGPLPAPGPYESIARAHGPLGTQKQRGVPPSVYLPELICPADAPAPTVQPGSFTSFVANCGMPDVRPTDEIPADWRENGVFTDQFPGDYKVESPITLDYIESYDGISHTVLISENVDAGLWTDTDEANIGFVFTTYGPDAPQSLERNIWRLNSRIGKGEGTIESARPSSYHLNGFNIARCDGASQFINEDIDVIAWAALLMTNSEEARYPGEKNTLLPLLYRHGEDEQEDTSTATNPIFNTQSEKSTKPEQEEPKE